MEEFPKSDAVSDKFVKKCGYSTYPMGTNKGKAVKGSPYRVSNGMIIPSRAKPCARSQPW